MNQQLPPNQPYPHFYPQSPAVENEEVDLRELFSALWRGKWIVITTTLILAASSVLYALSLPNIYKADALLAPAETSSGSGLSQMAGQLGGLASLAGVNLGSGEASQTDLAVQVMKSRQFVEAFINKHNLLVPLMAVKEWELVSNELVINEKYYDPAADKWLREPQGLRGAKPTAQEAFSKFSNDVFSIKHNKESGLYTISVKHFSPYIAQQWVNLLVEDINQVMRERTIAETSQNLTYLNTQLEKTSIADMQSTFYKLIEEQTKSLMLAEVQEEFVFKVVDPAVVPELKDGPKRALICLLGTILGGILGVVIVLARVVFRREAFSKSESSSN